MFIYFDLENIKKDRQLPILTAVGHNPIARMNKECFTAPPFHKKRKYINKYVHLKKQTSEIQGYYNQT